MAHSANLAAYEDIKMIFDNAIQSGLPAYYELPSREAAIRWRSRAYHFRKQTSVEEYQSLIFKIARSRPREVIIGREVVGVLRNANREEVPLTPATSEDKLEAERLAKELGIKL